jgi:hypothetical protein
MYTHTHTHKRIHIHISRIFFSTSRVRSQFNTALASISFALNVCHVCPRVPYGHGAHIRDI